MWLICFPVISRTLWFFFRETQMTPAKHFVFRFPEQILNEYNLISCLPFYNHNIALEDVIFFFLLARLLHSHVMILVIKFSCCDQSINTTYILSAVIQETIWSRPFYEEFSLETTQEKLPRVNFFGLFQVSGTSWCFKGIRKFLVPQVETQGLF